MTIGKVELITINKEYASKHMYFKIKCERRVKAKYIFLTYC